MVVGKSEATPGHKALVFTSRGTWKCMERVKHWGTCRDSGPSIDDSLAPVRMHNFVKEDHKGMTVRLWSDKGGVRVDVTFICTLNSQY